MPINLISKIKPKNNGSFPVCEDVDIEGGYQVRKTIADRNNIPALNRKLGMLVYVIAEQKYYTLIEDIDNDDWVEAQMGGGSFTPNGDLSGNSTTQRVVGLNTVPLPVSLPTDSQILKSTQPLLLSDRAFGITASTDGYSIYVADIFNPYLIDYTVNHYSNYGGIVKVESEDITISQRFDYGSENGRARIYTVAYLDGYLFATATINTDGWTNWILKISTTTGEILEQSRTDGLGMAWAAGNTLWITIPNAYDITGESSFLYKIDPDNLSNQTIVNFGTDGGRAGVPGFAYDNVNNKVWIAGGDTGLLWRLNPITTAIELTISDYSLPTYVAYGNESIWLYDNSTVAVYVIDPADGSQSQMVDDFGKYIDSWIGGMCYDDNTKSIWMIDNPKSYYRLVVNTKSYNRLIRIDTELCYVNGVCSLDYPYNKMLIAAGGYVWVVDNSTTTMIEPGGKSIVKIDPALVTSIPQSESGPFPDPPWNGKIASISYGELQYVFFTKNSSVTKDLTGFGESTATLSNIDEVAMCSNAMIIQLPQTPVDGQKHIIIDANGNSGSSAISVRYYSYGEYVTLFEVNNNNGVLTIMWSSTTSRWHIISYWYPQY